VEKRKQTSRIPLQKSYVEIYADNIKIVEKRQQSSGHIFATEGATGRLVSNMFVECANK
jgi:hypothetical protein